MVKRKLIVVVGVGVVVLAAAVGGGYWLSKKSSKNGDTNADGSNFKPTVAGSVEVAEEKALNDVVSASNNDSGDYQSSIAKSQALATDGSKPTAERMAAYKVCIMSAKKANNDEVAKKCRDDALALAATSKEPGFAEGWTYEINATYDPSLAKDTEGANDVTPQ